MFAVSPPNDYLSPHMARFDSRPTLPLGNWNNFPIYLSTILAGVLALGLVGTALLTSGGTPFLRFFVFAMPLEPAWSVWRLFTYVLIDHISFFSPFAILFF